MQVSKFILGVLLVVLPVFGTLYASGTVQNLEESLEALQDAYTRGDNRLPISNSIDRLLSLIPADAWQLQLKANKLYINCLEDLMKKAVTPRRKQLFLEQFKTVIEQRVAIVYELQQNKIEGFTEELELAFQIVDRNRNYQLRDNVNISNHKLRSISTQREAIEIQRKLLIEKYPAEGTAEEKKKFGRQVGLLESQRDSLVQLERDIISDKEASKLSDSLDEKPFSFLAFFSKMETSESIIQYFVGEEKVYAFVFAKGVLSLYECGNAVSIKEQVDLYRRCLSFISGKEHFLVAAHYLYLKLFKPFEPFLSGSRKIILVPDSFLGGVSFDALSRTPLTQNWDRDFATIDFLVKSYQFSYQYSAKQYTQQKRSKNDADPKVFVFAPVFDSKYYQEYTEKPDTVEFSLNQLPNTEKLINGLSRHFKGTNYLRQEATADNFYHTFSEEKKILHFATHTYVNDTMPLQSYIALAPNGTNKAADKTSNYYHRLSLAEIYQITSEHNIDLIILGSCETGKGELMTGKGISGFAYGFSLAGVKSLIYSLWALDENSTNIILYHFYKGLQAGEDKDSALRKAKLKYLSEHADYQTNSPFYWAGLVIAGDNVGYAFSTSYNKRLYSIIGGTIFFALILLVWLFQKYKMLGRFKSFKS